MYGRLEALPDQAEPLQRAQLLAALSAGAEITKLRSISSLLGPSFQLDAALAAVAQGDPAAARTWLRQLDCRLASYPGAEPGDADLLLQARAAILALSEALAQHSDDYFDSGAPA
jgi:hypothetical protein